jgi:environmental stress-induced protein Ves
MTLHRFHVEDLQATPWKNGGGVTSEIVCQPKGAGIGDFDWRVSIAHIASDGPFSAFPGVDRIITLLSGGGVHLKSSDGDVDHLLNESLLPFAFKGETNINASLLDEDCHDFNVMTRRSTCSNVSLQIVRSACDWPTTSHGLFMASHGHWQLKGPHEEHLAPQQGFWWSDSSLAWQLLPRSPDAALIALNLHVQKL